MKTASFHILRVGIAITFLWIGVLIFRQPEAWGGYFLPWAADILPMPLKEVMIGTAILDIVVGFLLLINMLVWPAALLATLHLATVIAVSITVRDIGLFAATLALAVDTWPRKYRFWDKSE